MESRQEVHGFALGEVDTSWAGSVLLLDIGDVKRLKQKDGPNPVTPGSTELVYALLANDLVDAEPLHSAGRARRWQEALRRRLGAHSFELARSRVSPKGLIVGHYAQGGEVETGGLPLDSPSEREICPPSAV